MKFHLSHLLIVGICIFSWQCTPAAVVGGKVDAKQLTDGTFNGFSKHGPNKANVRVTIKNKRIANIEILMHDAWKGQKAEPIIPKRIMDHQSTDVDVVTGATNSSRVIMDAVQSAIEKSCAKSSS